MPPARSERLRSVAASGVARKATHALSLTAEADAFVRPTACRRGCARTAVLRAADTADRSLQALPPSPIPSHPIPPMETHTGNARGQSAKWAALCPIVAIRDDPCRVRSLRTVRCSQVSSASIARLASASPSLSVRPAPRLASPRQLVGCPLCFTARVGLAALSRRKHRLHDMCGFACGVRSLGSRATTHWTIRRSCRSVTRARSCGRSTSTAAPGSPIWLW
jgi:hypothetical protein